MGLKGALSNLYLFIAHATLYFIHLFIMINWIKLWIGLKELTIETPDTILARVSSLFLYD